MSLFINKARTEGRNDALYYVLGVLGSFIGGQILGAIPIIALMLQHGVFDQSVLTNPELLHLNSNQFLILMLLPFVVSYFLLWVFIRFVHKKRMLVSWTAFDKFDWKKLFFSFFLWFIMSASIDVIACLMKPGNYEFHFSGINFFILLIISFTLLPIQTTFEELLFRSYLMQAIGMWKPYRIIPFLITSLAFGLMHIANPEIKEYGYITLTTYIGIGFLLGLITLLSDSMELAIGLHAANNIYGSTMVSFKGSVLTTESLFYTKEMTVDATSIILFFIVMIIFYLIVNWKYKLLPISSLWEKFDYPTNQ